MDNHFGKGLMAGMRAAQADTAKNVAHFCSDYKRGFVLGFSHRMFEKTGDRQLSAWEAGNFNASLRAGSRHGDGLLQRHALKRGVALLYGGLPSRRVSVGDHLGHLRKLADFHLT